MVTAKEESLALRDAGISDFLPGGPGQVKEVIVTSGDRVKVVTSGGRLFGKKFEEDRARKVAQVLANLRAKESGATKQQEEQAIKKAFNQRLNTLTQDFKQDLRGAKNVQDRLEIINKFETDKALSLLQAQGEKVEAGISKGFQRFGISVTPTTATGILQQIKEQPQQIIAGAEQQEQFKPTKDKLFDTSTFSGRLKNTFIEQDPILGGLARKIFDLKTTEGVLSPETNKKLNQLFKTLDNRLEKIFGVGGKVPLPFGLAQEEGKPEGVSQITIQYVNAVDKFITQPIRSTPKGKAVIEAIESTPLGRINEDVALSLLDAFLKFSFFSPFLETAVANKKTGTKQKVIEKTTKKVVKKKISKQNVELNLQFKQQGKIVREKTFLEKLKDTRSMVNALRNTQPAKRQKLFIELRKLLRDTHGNVQADKLLQEVFSQQGLLTFKPTTSTATKTSLFKTTDIITPKLSKTITPVQTGTGFIGEQVKIPVSETKTPLAFQTSGLRKELEDFILFNQKGPELSKLSSSQVNKLFPDLSNSKNIFGKVAGVEGKFGLGIKGKISSLGELEGVLGSSGRNAFNTIINTAQRNAVVLRNIELTKQNLNQATSNIQKNMLKNRLNILEQQLSRLNQQQSSAQKSLLSQASLSKQRLRLRQQQRLRLRQRGRTPRKPRITKIVIPLPFGIKGKKKTIKPTKRKNNFQVFVRKAGKDIKLKSFGSLPKARRTLKKNLAVTLRASGFIVDRKTKKRVIPKISKGFRLSKIRKNVLVEKRHLRLSSQLERSSIQKFRRQKKAFNNKSNLKSTSMIKVRGRRR